MKIPQEDWAKYPETKPNQSGYYFTSYLDVATHQLFYKCIYWCDKRQDWISWRPTPHPFEVGCYVEKTRTDFYSSCLKKLDELYLKK